MIVGKPSIDNFSLRTVGEGIGGLGINQITSVVSKVEAFATAGGEVVYFVVVVVGCDSIVVDVFDVVELSVFAEVNGCAVFFGEFVGVSCFGEDVFFVAVTLVAVVALSAKSSFSICSCT